MYIYRMEPFPMTLSNCEWEPNFQRQGASRRLFTTFELLVYFINGNLPTPDHWCTLLLPTSVANDDFQRCHYSQGSIL